MPTALYNHATPGIYIENPAGDVEFFSRAKMALNILRSRDVGKKLLEDLSAACKNGKSVVIEKSLLATAVPTKDVSDNFRQQIQQPGVGKLLVADAFDEVVRGKSGCSAIARWNPSNTIAFSNIQRPSFLSLGHELIHALHYLTADCYRKINDVPTLNAGEDSGLAEEEARTTGLGPYKNTALSENAIRAAFKEPLRTEYVAGNDLSHVKVTSV